MKYQHRLQWRQRQRDVLNCQVWSRNSSQILKATKARTPFGRDDSCGAPISSVSYGQGSGTLTTWAACRSAATSYCAKPC
jgi:hypothetical protein